MSINIFTLQYYDIRKKCEGSLCYDFSNMEKFLNQKPVRDALAVGDLDFVSCSPTVYQAMLVDWMRNLEVGIPTLLEDGVNLLVYAGEYDLICNWLGKLLGSIENQHYKSLLDLPMTFVPYVIQTWGYNFFFVGNSRWVHAMEWSGQQKFVASPEVPFVVNGSEAGVLKSHGALTFLKVSPPLSVSLIFIPNHRHLHFYLPMANGWFPA
jgi:serine carboxypeptidase-like clade 4